MRCFFPFFVLFIQFLGCTPVDQAKGIETVKDAIRRLQFSQQIKKAESGSNVKTKKVEITISVDGVAVQVGSFPINIRKIHCNQQLIVYLFQLLLIDLGATRRQNFTPIPIAQYLVLCRREGGEKVFQVCHTTPPNFYTRIDP